MTAEEIKTKIADLKKELSEVKGTKCQVYTRVVGYLRPVQAFNVGKKEEYKSRKLYDVGNGKEAHKTANELHSCNMCKYKL